MDKNKGISTLLQDLWGIFQQVKDSNQDIVKYRWNKAKTSNNDCKWLLMKVSIL